MRFARPSVWRSLPPVFLRCSFVLLLLADSSFSRHPLANLNHQSARASPQRSTRPTSPPVEHLSELLALPGCALLLTPAAAGPPQSTQVESLDVAEAESHQRRSTVTFRCLTVSSHTIPMVCSIEDSSRVHYAEVALDDKTTLQEPKRQPVTVVDMRNSGLAEVNQLSEQEATAASKNSIWLLAYCCIGIMISFTLNGVVLEKITTHRVLGELSMTFVFCVFNSVVAIGLSRARKEKPSTMPQSFLAIVGALAFGSTIASMVALRYVTYITRILGKSCKSIPVMIMGVLLGKKYAFKKYVSVIVLCIGVAVFLLGTAHEKQHKAVQHDDSHNSLPEQERTPNMVLGFSLLVLSLIFDGATGALEDKFMEAYHIGAFDLMYYVNIYKALFSAVGMVVNGEIPVFLEFVIPSLPNLMMLSLTGAFGQAFIFFTISKFGALTTAIIGTCRKVLSIVLSVVLFGHVLSLEQTAGLGLSFLGIGLNWVNTKNCFSKSSPVPTAAAEPIELDDLSKEGLLESSSDDTADSESDEQDGSAHDDDEDEAMSAETARKLELVNAWHRQTAHEAETSSNGEEDGNNDVPAQIV